MEVRFWNWALAALFSVIFILNVLCAYTIVCLCVCMYASVQRPEVNRSSGVIHLIGLPLLK